MDSLTEAGVGVDMITLNTDVDFDNIKSYQLYGIYPFSFGKTLTFLKDHGKKIVYDNDDALELIDTLNPFYYSVKKDTVSQQEILKFADHITVSTPVIAELMKGRTNKPITVIPNAYNPREWTFTRVQKEGIRIGFVGSPTHVMDLIEILPVIKKLQQKYNITFVLGLGSVGGNYESWYKDFCYVSHPDAVQTIEKFHSLLEGIKFEWVPYLDFGRYPELLTSLALDIGICPLKDTPFNRARSACKSMEYTLTGALALASDLPPYQEDSNSILVKDTDWEETLSYYIENPEMRKARQLEHLEWTKKNRNLFDQAPLFRSIYEV